MIPFSYVAFVEVKSLIGASDATYNTVVNEWELTGDRYALAQYAPTIAPLRRSRLGGDGAYDDVIDTITVHVLGDTASDAVANFEDLLRPLDQASRWDRLEAVNVIQIRVQVRQGTADVLAAVIMGPSSGEVPATPSPQFDESIGRFIIRDVVLRFRRRGAWLGLTVDDDADGIETGEVLTLSFGTNRDHPVLSPVRLRISTPDTAVAADDAGFIAWSEAGCIVLIDAADFTDPPPLGVGTAAVSTARGGFVLAYNPPDTNVATAGTLPISLPSTVKRAHVFASVINNSASSDFLIGLELANFNTGEVLQSTPPIRIGANINPSVYVVYLGQFDNPGDAWPVFQITMQATVASAGSLRIGTLTIVGDTGETAGVLAVTNTAYEPTDTIASIDHRLLLQVSPEVARRVTADDPGNFAQALNAFGDRVPQMSGSEMDLVVFIANGNGNVSTTWRPFTAAPALCDLSVEFRRNRAYRVPQ